MVKQADYQKSLGLKNEEFDELKGAVSRLFDAHLLDCDSRFARLADALLFREKYLYNLPDLKVISVALEDVYKNILSEQVVNSNIKDTWSIDQSAGQFLGYDILGCDGGSFHSYLCNGLNKNISEKYLLEVDDCGIIQNPYDEVKAFVECIKDKGEPVVWLPFTMYEHFVQ